MINKRVTLPIYLFIGWVIIWLLLTIWCSMCEASEYKFAKNWTWQDTGLELVFTLEGLADWSQTKWMAKNNWAWDGGQHYELNPFMSKHPSTGEVDFWCPVEILAHAVISMALPPHYEVFGVDIHPRLVWQSVTIVVEGGNLAHNRSVGVGFAF